MTDEQKQENENLEAGGYGAKVSIPKWAGAYVGPYLKYVIVLFGVGMLVIMVCYGISLVTK